MAPGETRQRREVASQETFKASPGSRVVKIIVTLPQASVACRHMRSAGVTGVVVLPLFISAEINSTSGFIQFETWLKANQCISVLRSVTLAIVTQVTNLNHGTSSSLAPLRSHPGAVKRLEWQWPAWSGPHATPYNLQCSFPFHLECEIAAGAALTSALRGQLLKSDVRLSG